MSEIWDLTPYTLNVPKANLEAAKKIAKKLTAGNTSAYINMVLFNAILEAVEKGIIAAEEIEEI